MVEIVTFMEFLKLMFVTIPMYFITIAKTIQCCDKLWFLGVFIVTRRDLQRSIVIRLNLAIYCKSKWYTLQKYLPMDSVLMIKKDCFLRLIVFTIVNIMSTDEKIPIWYFWSVFSWYFLVFTEPIPVENLVGTFQYYYFGRNPFFPQKGGHGPLFWGA
jgi:hypothetical protein